MSYIHMDFGPDFDCGWVLLLGGRMRSNVSLR